MFQHAAARRQLDFVVTLYQSQQKGFNTQPPEGSWAEYGKYGIGLLRFQHAAARRQLGSPIRATACCAMFQHAAARRQLGTLSGGLVIQQGFNTQPPEGSWDAAGRLCRRIGGFNTQPPEGSW